jgi:hypothetical protein
MVWLSARVYVPNAYLAASEDVLAALPARATRDIMNGNPTALFNPRAADPVWVVNHKVYALSAACGKLIRHEL